MRLQLHSVHYEKAQACCLKFRTASSALLRTNSTKSSCLCCVWSDRANKAASSATWINCLLIYDCLHLLPAARRTPAPHTPPPFSEAHRILTTSTNSYPISAPSPHAHPPQSPFSRHPLQYKHPPTHQSPNPSPIAHPHESPHNPFRPAHSASPHLHSSQSRAPSHASAQRQCQIAVAGVHASGRAGWRASWRGGIRVDGGIRGESGRLSCWCSSRVWRWSWRRMREVFERRGSCRGFRGLRVRSMMRLRWWDGLPLGRYGGWTTGRMRVSCLVMIVLRDRAEMAAFVCLP
jgi:hypothetical protein